MHSKNMKLPSSFTGYLGEVNEATFFFEYFVKDNVPTVVSSIARVLQADTRDLVVINDDANIRGLLPNYYYTLTCSIDGDDESLRVTSDNIQYYETIGVSPEIPLFIKAQINHTLTSEASRRFTDVQRKLGKLERLKADILYAFTSSNIKQFYLYQDWLFHKMQNKANLERYLNDESIADTVIRDFDEAIKSVIPNFNISLKSNAWNDKSWVQDVLPLYNEIREALIVIRDYTGAPFENERYAETKDINLREIYSNLLNYQGIGDVSLSSLLNALNSKYFPIYSRDLYKFMQYIGFELELKFESPMPTSPAIRYYNYQTYINEMFKSFTVFLDDELNGNYDAANYYIRKELRLRLFEL